MSARRRLRLVVLLIWVATARPGLVAAEVLTSLTALRALSHADAGRSLPVRVEATVLGRDPASPWNLFVHDGAAGCYVNLIPEGNPPEPTPGTRVRVEGVSLLLGYYPSIGRGRATAIGRAEVPAPHRLTAEQIHAPEFDSAWVEVPAFITGVVSGEDRVTLEAEVYGLTLKAELPPERELEARITGLMLRPVVLRGVLGTIFNRQRQMTDRHLFLPSLGAVEPLPTAGAVALTPQVTIAQLLTAGFGPQTPVSVAGVVTQADPRGFHLRDATGSTRVLAPPQPPLPSGTRVVVNGFAGVAPFRPVLRAGKVEVLGTGPPPEPVAFTGRRADWPALHAERVTLEAVLLARQERRFETILECQHGTELFEAILPAGEARPPALGPGDRLRLTGVCELTTTRALPRMGWIDGFRLQLPGPEGIEVVARAPWWTPRRLAFALGVTGIVAVAGLSGTWIFRRQVRRQLAVIGDSMRQEAVARERDRMARDLHDTLEQQLSGVALQLDGVDGTMRTDPEVASRSLSIARRMLRFTRLEARRSVWDLRSRVLEEQGLFAALQHMAESAAGPGGPAVTVREAGAPRRLSAAVEFHLFRIAQEALTNAVKHAQAHRVAITWEHSAELSRLVVSDDGRGFDPAVLERATVPHFGLPGMRERAARIGADFAVAAAAAAGCTLTVTVPVPPAAAAHET